MQITFADLIKGGYWQAFVSDCAPPRSRNGNPIQNSRSIRLSGPHLTESDALKAAQASIDSGWANGSTIIHRPSAKPSASFVLAAQSIDAIGRLRDILRTAALACRDVTEEPVAADEEMYEIGKRDGYEEAVQEIDQLTGGDGEYRYCSDIDPDRHTPDAATMILRIVDRFETLNTLDEAIKAEEYIPPQEPVAVKALEWVEQIEGEWWIADRYRVEKFDGGGFAARSKGPQSGALQTFCFGVSFDEAKAAAQADYETRILSALARPLPLPSEEKMREALEKAYIRGATWYQQNDDGLAVNAESFLRKAARDYADYEMSPLTAAEMEHGKVTE